MNKNRILVSNITECPYSCSYCFAKFQCYDKESMPAPEDVEVLRIDSSTVYMSCDSEIFLDKRSYHRLLDISASSDSLVVNFSTKKKLSNTNLSQLMNIDSMLRNNNGFLKISISITNKYQIDKIECGTSSYQERLEMFSRITDANIQTSINLKPILPFISTEEYFEIINDFSSINTVAFLLGGLYIDPNSIFGKQIINNFPDFIRKREVSWLPSKPIWLICEDICKKKAIENEIISSGSVYFDTDLEIVRFLRDNIKRPENA